MRKQVKEYTDELIVTLEEQLGLVEDLLNCAGVKETLLTGSDLDALKEVLQQEEELVSTLHEKEEKRKKITVVLAEALGFSDENLPLKKLAEHLEDTTARSNLVETGFELKLAMQKLTKRNDRVKALVKIQSDYTDFMIQMLYNAQNNSHLYYNLQGNKEENAGQISRLDIHA